MRRLVRVLGWHDLRELVRDAHAYGGAALVALGAGLVYPPAAAIVFGGFLVYLGFRGKPK